MPRSHLPRRGPSLVPLLTALLLGTGCGGSGGGEPEIDQDLPVVLAHGFAGFDRIAGIMDYWFEIPAAMEEDGARVFVTEVSPANSSLVRGEQLLAQVEEIVAISGEPRVHLIGHSQGGIDARYVAGVRPDLVASITTVATPHTLAEEFAVPSDPLTAAIAQAFMGFLGDFITLLSTNEQPNDPAGAVTFFEEESYDSFNAMFPMGLPTEPCGEAPARVDGIRLYSWTGIALDTTALDPIDLVFAATGSVFDEENDGLVERCSAHFGTVIRDDYRHNHVDEVNLLFGLVPEDETHPTTIFREHWARLRGPGSP